MNQLFLYIDCFMFGSRSRHIFYAIIFQGLSVLSLLSFTTEGLLDTTILPQFEWLLTAFAVVSVLGTYYISKSASMTSFSEILHTRFVPGLIAVGYLILGLLATAAGFLAYLFLYQTSIALTLKEFWIGICIGLVLGFLILLYYDRSEIEMPNDYYRFEEASKEMLDNYKFLRESNLPPIDLTGRYGALEDSVRELLEILEKSTTMDGKKLAQDINQWLEAFSSKPEPAKDRIVGNSGTPEEEELKRQRQEFESVIRRIRRIGNHE